MGTGQRARCPSADVRCRFHVRPGLGRRLHRPRPHARLRYASLKPPSVRSVLDDPRKTGKAHASDLGGLLTADTTVFGRANGTRDPSGAYLARQPLDLRGGGLDVAGRHGAERTFSRLLARLGEVFTDALDGFPVMRLAVGSRPDRRLAGICGRSQP